MGIQKKTAAPSADTGTEDEIDQIMSEIELLQQKMEEAPKMTAPTPAPAPTSPAKLRKVEAPAPEPEEDVMGEFRGSSDEPSMEETLGGLGEDESVSSGTSLLDQAIGEMDEEEGQEEEGMSMNQQGREKPGEGNLTMTLSGNMSLKLCYECGGQEVTLGFSDQTLRVQLADGTEFKIPVGQRTLKKVA